MRVSTHRPRRLFSTGSTPVSRTANRSNKEDATMRRFLWSGCLAIVLTLLGTSHAYAQATASISGVVRDVAGGVVPGVTITVKDDATGRSVDTVSGVDGQYQISSLLAGTYTVTAKLTGFKTAV